MSFRDTQKTRPAFREKPLSGPGESLQKEIDRVINEEILWRILVVFFLIIMTLYEWMHYKWNLPHSPHLFAMITILYSIYLIRFIKKRLPYLRALKMGLTGEKLVGQYLEKLRRYDCHVFHDIDCCNFNIDHVVVGPQGIFVIETKTFSKPEHGCPTIEFDGEEILVDTRKPERNPVEQVRALKDWFEQFLFDTTGHRYPVSGIVVVPGWYVIKKASGKNNVVRVFNHKSFLTFVKKQPVVLQNEDISLVSSRIADYIREKGRV